MRGLLSLEDSCLISVFSLVFYYEKQTYNSIAKFTCILFLCFYVLKKVFSCKIVSLFLNMLYRYIKVEAVLVIYCVLLF